MKTMIGTTAPKLEATVYVDPDFVLRILPHVDEMAVNDKRSLVFQGNGITHVISSISRVVNNPPEEQAKKPQAMNIEDDDIPF